MQKKFQTKNLKVGMYVILPGSWLSYNFIKGRFIIKSEDQIKKIINAGFDEVLVDDTKGTYDFTKVKKDKKEDNKKKQKIIAPKEWKPLDKDSISLKDVLNNKDMPAEKRANAIYSSSINIMKNILAEPSAENISRAKTEIKDVVDIILSQEDTTSHLLQISSYDSYTYIHSVRVGILSTLLAKEALKKGDKFDMHELGAGFFLHDIGKTNLSSAIINKPGKLNDKEINEMRKHPYQGYLILKETDQLTEECRIIVMQHHEREDGWGYPRRLKGDSIHIYGKICSIADVYDALTSERSYKQSMPAFNALNIMKDEMIDHFHAELFNQFLALFKNK